MDPSSTDFCNDWMLLKSNVQVFQILQYCIRERVPNIIGMILTLLNRQSLYLKGQVNIFLLFVMLFQAYLAINRASDSKMWHLFVLLSITTIISGLLCDIFWHIVWMVTSQRILALSFSSMLSGAYSNHFTPVLNPYWRNGSQCWVFATVLCLWLCRVGKS